MRKAFNLRPVQARSSVSRSSGTHVKTLAPFCLKYYRPQCMFLPRNLCIIRGEIDYVASNPSIDSPGDPIHPSDAMSDIWRRVVGRNWTRPDAPFLGADFRYGSFASILACPRHVRLGGNLGNAGCPVLPVEGVGLDVIQAPKPEPRIMRYELTDFEWAAIRSFLPNKPRGVPRVDDRRVLNGIFWVLRSGAPWRDLPETYGPRTTCYNRFARWRQAASGTGSWTRWPPVMTRRCR